MPTSSLGYYFYNTVEVLIGDDDDYIITGSPLMFGASASPTKSVRNEELCFYFTAVQESIKEEEDKFKLSLSTSDSDIELDRDQGHISILKDPVDGMEICFSILILGIKRCWAKYLTLG